MMKPRTNAQHLATIICGAVALALNPFAVGATLAALWSWFIAPTFGAPELSWQVAWGCAAIVGLLRIGPSLASTVAREKAAMEDESAGLTIARSFAPSIVAFGAFCVGAVVAWTMP